MLNGILTYKTNPVFFLRLLFFQVAALFKQRFDELISPLFVITFEQPRYHCREGVG